MHYGFLKYVLGQYWQCSTCITTRCQSEFTVRGQKPKIWIFQVFYDFHRFNTALHWKVIFRIFLQTNELFLLFQDFGNMSRRNPIVNWEDLRFFLINIIIRVSFFFQKLDLEAYLLPRAGHIPQEPSKKNQIYLSCFLEWPCDFVYT